jgi:Flp pilus assembly protein TadD
MAPLSGRPWLVAAALAIATAIVFMPAVGFDFVNWDDRRYLFENEGLVSDGLTAKNISRAMTETTFYNWAPLTILSYQCDATLFGMKPWGFHLTNLLIHAVSAALLFQVLLRMTGRSGASAAAAALFAVHPLRVESVAWVAERKDVLSVVFLMLALLAYDAYCRQPSWGRYLAVCGAMLMSLLAKATIVTLPVLLLLLDVWPLGRLALPGIGDRVSAGDADVGRYRSRSASEVIGEKLPLFVLSLLFSIITLRTQAPVIAAGTALPLVTVRVPVAVVATGWYLQALVLPYGLHPAYLHPAHNGYPTWLVAVSFACVCLVGVVAWIGRRRQPWGIVGLAWFLVALAPMSGVVGQQGCLSHADRFTYIPHIGLIVAVIWAGDDLWRRLAAPPSWAVASLGLVVGVCILQSERQLQHWRNSYSLWTHTLALDARSSNWIAHNNFGLVLAERGQIDDALAHYRLSVEINPLFDESHFNLANALTRRGEIDEAIAHYAKALEINPDDCETENNLGLALAARGRGEEAVGHFRRAIEIKPSYVDAHNNLGIALAGRGQIDEAIVQYREALNIRPDHVESRTNLGNALANTGQIDEAIRQYRSVLQINPYHVEAHYNLGSALVVRGRREDAIEHYRRALELATSRNDTAVADAVRVQIGRLVQ